VEHDLRFQLAALYEDMKLPWRARPHYQKVLEIDANNIKAQERLRLLDAEPGENDMSEPSFMDRIFRHSPSRFCVAHSLFPRNRSSYFETARRSFCGAV